MDFSLRYKRQRDKWFRNTSSNATALHAYIEQTRRRELQKISQETYGVIRKQLRTLQSYYTTLRSTLTIRPIHQNKEKSVRIHFKYHYEPVSHKNCSSHITQYSSDTSADALIYNITQELIPWRKGPFAFNHIHIETEWNSYAKWERLGSIFSFEHLCKDKSILDIGANNMYYDFLMIEQGAKQVLAIDPLERYRLFHEFYMTLLSCNATYPLYFEMLGIDDAIHLPQFDTVFFMGILYHRRNPLDSLEKLHTLIRKGGFAVIETLCIPSKEDYCLVPVHGYQKSKGYWFIPSLSILQYWIKRSNFDIVHTGDLVPTLTNEQQQSPWIRGESLEHFLDPEDNNKTIEGYPAPHRVIVVIRKP